MSSVLNQGASERAPTLAESIRRALDAHAREAWRIIPAAVSAYAPSTGKANCQILVNTPYLDESDARQVDAPPVVPGVPVMFLGSNVYRTTFPISDGTLVVNGTVLPATTGLLLFCDRSIDAWLSGSGQAVDPGIDHFVGKMDAVFLPGLWPFQAFPEPTPQDSIALGQVAGNDFVALAQKVTANLNALKTHFAAIEAVLTGSVINEPGNGLPSALQAALKLAITPGNAYPNPTSVAASQVKAK